MKGYSRIRTDSCKESCFDNAMLESSNATDQRTPEDTLCCHPYWQLEHLQLCLVFVSLMTKASHFYQVTEEHVWQNCTTMAVFYLVHMHDV